MGVAGRISKTGDETVAKSPLAGPGSQYELAGLGPPAQATCSPTCAARNPPGSSSRFRFSLRKGPLGFSNSFVSEKLEKAYFTRREVRRAL